MLTEDTVERAVFACWAGNRLIEWAMGKQPNAERGTKDFSRSIETKKGGYRFKKAPCWHLM